MTHIVSDSEWLQARLALLQQEKALTRMQDEVAATRRALPMRNVNSDYQFQTNNGVKSLADLFGAQRQLIVYHFMFGPEWEQGCPSCSFWADNFNGFDQHLVARDTQLVTISNAPLEKLNHYKQRLGWNFEWVSAEGNSFNADFAVSFYQGDQSILGQGYNYSNGFSNEELPGISVFYRLDDGSIAHSYSCFARGLEVANAAYHLLDLTPQGRNESELAYPMAWVKRRDAY